MSLLHVYDIPNPEHLIIYDVAKNHEKYGQVRLSGILQMTSSGYLIVAVPTALVRGLFDAIHEPGISLPSVIDGGALRAGIVVMTPDEVKQIGGADKISERGKQFVYFLGDLQEAPAKGWPGVSTCWHMRINSPELGKLRRTYGLPTKLEGMSDFSIVVACRKVGVLTANETSKTINQQDGSKLPDWTLP